jgi:endonuclease/exonuclease/phosphatase family metal-dependent hydrolase
MKLMTLNIWGGHIKKPLLEFVNSHRDIDIFCFQEVYSNASTKISTEDREVSLNIFLELQSILTEHNAFFRPVVDGIYGIGMLVKKDIDVLDEGEVLIHDNPNYSGRGPTHSRNLQWLQYKSENVIHSVLNVHALWNGQGKTDTPARIAQSKKIQEFISTIKTPKILCGDFNLRPDTESIKLIENGMNNLITKYNIQSTRSSLYPKEERFADYIFVSPEVTINSFEVLNMEVSDHLPLLLNYNV